MRVFLTGATGFIGSAVIPELLNAGHQVLGLTRSDEGAAALTAAGAEVHRGSLEDLDSLKRGAAAADGIIHLAFIHDFSKYTDNCETDRRAIEAMGSVLEGTTKPFVITSGTAIVGAGKKITEYDVAAADSKTIPRLASEEAAAAVAARGVNVSLVRLPPSVHGEGEHGFIPILINIAREKGVSVYVGEGNNRWPAVHRFDAARLFRLALESGAAEPRYHAIGDEGIPVRQIAEVIGRHLNIPVASKSPEEAMQHFGWLGGFMALDIPASAKLTEQRLQWQPTHPGLIEDMEVGHYFLSEQD